MESTKTFFYISNLYYLWHFTCLITLNLSFCEERTTIQVIDNGIDVPAAIIEGLTRSNHEKKGREYDLC